MSIDVMNTVWKRAPLSGGDLLMLLAIADNADDNGVAFPGMQYLASKARMSQRNAQRCVSRIAEAGFMKIEPNRGPSGSNRYKINVSLLEGLDKNFTPSRRQKEDDNLSPHDNLSPVTFEAEGVTSTTGGDDAGVTLTVIEPSEEPLSARACARDGENDKLAVSETVEDPKAVKRDFQRFVNNWPGFAGMSLQSAEVEFMRLTAEDRAIAMAKRDAWIALLRRQGKDYTPKPSRYLKERLWEAVPDLTDEAKPEHSVAAPFGKAWTVHILKALNAGHGVLPPAPAFIARQIAEDTAIGRREALDRQARHGWPAVNFAYQQASEGKGIHIATEDRGELPEMEAVMINSSTFDAWRIAFSDRGWPWMTVPHGVRVVWFPKGGPSSLDHPPIQEPYFEKSAPTGNRDCAISPVCNLATDTRIHVQARELHDTHASGHPNLEEIGQ